MAHPGGSLHVLVVDDSAVARQCLAQVLSADGGIMVEVSSDAVLAQEKIRRRRPDVIVLDLELPRLSGLDFLRQLMAGDPVPVVVCSTLAQRGTEVALRAIEEGAVDVVAKPRFDVRGFLLDSATLLVDAVRAAAQARLRTRGLPPRPRAAAAVARPATPDDPRRKHNRPLVAIGASTGGTEAIREILEALPAEAPPLVIVQHMPEVFTRTFAERLDSTCQLEVREAQDGDAVVDGRALVAAGDRHLRVVRRRGQLVAEVTVGPLVSRHRPSVDVLFRSVAEVAGRSAVGVLLTGMGSDGADGLVAMRARGAITLAQDEESCVVFGMPKEAILRGGVTDVLPLDRMAEAILRQG